MSELYLPLEDPAAHTKLEQAMGEEMTAEQFGVVLKTAEGEAQHSLLAASLLETNRGKPYHAPHATMLIEGARSVSSHVRSFGKTLDDSPNEILFLADEYRLYLANTDDTTLALTERGQVKFQLGRFASTYSGSIGIVEIHDETHVWGRNDFTVDPSIFQSQPPAKSTIDHSAGYLTNVRLGRNRILEIYKERVEEESDIGLIESRLKSVPYAMWLMRHIDPQLSRSMHASAVRVGLVDVWREQSLNETGAFLVALQRRRPRTAIKTVDMLGGYGVVQLEEVKRFKSTAEEIAQRALLHAERRRVKQTSEALHKLAAHWIETARAPLDTIDS